jgi:hypothetical protein
METNVTSFSVGRSQSSVFWLNYCMLPGFRAPGKQCRALQCSDVGAQCFCLGLPLSNSALTQPAYFVSSHLGFRPVCAHQHSYTAPKEAFSRCSGRLSDG